MSRLPLLLPAFAACAVAIALFVASRPPPELAVRVYGGPTDRPRFSGYIELTELELTESRAAAGRQVEVRVSERGEAKGEEVSVRSDAAGRGWFSFDLSKHPHHSTLDLAVVDRAGERERVRARGKIRQAHDEWLARAGRRGGWVTAGSQAALQVRAAAVSGVLAVPFWSQLRLEVSTKKGPVSGALVQLHGDGVELGTGHADLERTSGSDGRLLFALRPLEHSAELHVRISAGEQGAAELTLGLEIVPGALSVKLDGSRLEIQSPVPRSEAFFAVANEETRYQGGRLALRPRPDGTSVGQASLTDLPARPFWIVVSSEPDLRSPGVVGWPLAARDSEPLTTLEIQDELLLDGIPQARSRQTARQGRVIALAASACALALLLVAGWLVRSARASKHALGAHLERTLTEDETRERIADPGLNALRLVLGLLTVGLGFVVFLLILLYRAA